MLVTMLVPLLELLHEIETALTLELEPQVTQETLNVLVYQTILATSQVTSQETSVEYALVLT